MNFRNTAAIAVLFVALGGYLYFFESEKMRQEGAGETLFPEVEAAEVSGVTLTYPDTEIVLAKTAAGWRIQKPIEAAADQTTVENLVQALADAEVKRTLEEKPESLAPFGLDKPQAVVALRMQDDSRIPAVKIGKTAPVGYSSYIQLADSDKVMLSSSSLPLGMKKELRDLRTKEIFDFSTDQVQAIEITGGDSPVALARDGAAWKIEKPKPLAADEEAVEKFLSSLKTLRAEDFYDAPSSLAEFGLDTPRRRITIEVGQERTKKELTIGGEQEKEKKTELYVKRGDAETVFAVASWTWDALDASVAELRDKTLARFDRDKLAAVEVKRASGDSYRLTKTGEAWTVDGVDKANLDVARSLVDDLAALKGYEIAAEDPKDLSNYGLTSPALTVTALDADAKPLARVLLSQRPGAPLEDEAAPPLESYAMAEGSSVVLKIRENEFSNLDKARGDVVEAPAEAGTADVPAIDAPGQGE